jgi:signal transduction histidine kinase
MLLPKKGNNRQALPSTTEGLQEILRAPKNMTSPDTGTGVPFPLRWLAVGLVFTVVVLLTMLWFAFDSFRSVTTVQLRDLHLQELSGHIVHLDEVLTMSARMAATTGDLQWERRYRQFEPQLDSIIKETMQLTSLSESAEATKQTDVANLKLVDMENQSFALVRAGQPGQAKLILFGDAYEVQKKIYAEGILRLVQYIQEDLAASQRDKRNQAIFFVTTALLSIVFLFVTWLLVWSKLHRWRADQTANFAALAKVKAALHIAHDDLEKRVKERTEQLEQMHKRLLEASRKAGMAEIANNVLHNVGNVLNSVNISAEQVSRKMHASKAQGLAKAVQLINEHAADLGDFMTRDERGKLLPDYLNQLVEALRAEQQSVVEELGHLTNSVDHIKDIVTTQQSYAGVSAIVEPLQIIDLLEEALRMHIGALTRHQVTVVKEFAKVPVLLLDKHKVLLILINLISNAKNAMTHLVDRSRKMTLSVDVMDKGNLRVCVKDEGEGIAPENLARIFAHGFTTRKDGHGFGLHSCALAAMEMEGTLTAHSDGPGKGAIFTLEIPLKSPVGGL